jgi:hypothetical protein
MKSFEDLSKSKPEHKLIVNVPVHKARALLKALGEQPAPGYLHAKVDPAKKDKLLELLGHGEVGVSRWIQGMLEAYLLHEERRDGECARFLKIIEDAKLEQFGRDLQEKRRAARKRRGT